MHSGDDATDDGPYSRTRAASIPNRPKPGTTAPVRLANGARGPSVRGLTDPGVPPCAPPS
ncbi:MAG: hypothetical protein EBR82_24675 [Caulobacteraceae bacterium]|nr:hypothetical protein [Caulobacteraceae bacterium]